jgi:rhodanese-related sulfurtransferase
MSSIQQVDARTASQWAASGEAIIIDVREVDEYAQERIDGALLNPLSRFDPNQVPDADRIVLQCRSGKRSMDAAARLAALGRTELYNLQGGIIAWREAGLPVQQGPAR